MLSQRPAASANAAETVRPSSAACSSRASNISAGKEIDRFTTDDTSQWYDRSTTVRNRSSPSCRSAVMCAAVVPVRCPRPAQTHGRRDSWSECDGTPAESVKRRRATSRGTPSMACLSSDASAPRSPSAANALARDGFLHSPCRRGLVQGARARNGAAQSLGHSPSLSVPLPSRTPKGCCRRASRTRRCGGGLPAPS